MHHLRFLLVIKKTIGKTSNLKKVDNGDFPACSVVKNLLANAGDIGDTSLIPGLRRSPGEGNGNPLQYSCLENPMYREAWWAIAQRGAKSHQ